MKEEKGEEVRKSRKVAWKMRRKGENEVLKLLIERGQKHHVSKGKGA